MSTHARIGIRNADQSITSIYLHYDGGPAKCSRTLLRKYKSEEEIRKLIDFGDLHSLKLCALPSGVETVELRSLEADTRASSHDDTWPDSAQHFDYLYDWALESWYYRASGYKNADQAWRALAEWPKNDPLAKPQTTAPTVSRPDVTLVADVAKWAASRGASLSVRYLSKEAKFLVAATAWSLDKSPHKISVRGESLPSIFADLIEAMDIVLDASNAVIRQAKQEEQDEFCERCGGLRSNTPPQADCLMGKEIEGGGTEPCVWGKKPSQT